MARDVFRIHKLLRGERLSYSLWVAVGQKDGRPLRELQRLYGGSIQHNGGGIEKWVITTQQAAVALEHMLPYLRVKREQAEIALAFQSRRRPRGRKDPGQDERDELDHFAIRLAKVVAP